MATRRITTRSTASSSASISTKTDRKIAPTANAIKPRYSGTKRKAAKIDAMKPKKPPTAFFYFLEDFRKEYKQKNPDVKAMRDIGKACGEKWKTMTYEEKVQYYDTATEKRAEFDMATADFIKRKERGEFDESDSDSEYDG